MYITSVIYTFSVAWRVGGNSWGQGDGQSATFILIQERRSQQDIERTTIFDSQYPHIHSNRRNTQNTMVEDSKQRFGQRARKHLRASFRTRGHEETSARVAVAVRRAQICMYLNRHELLYQRTAQRAPLVCDSAAASVCGIRASRQSFISRVGLVCAADSSF